MKIYYITRSYFPMHTGGTIVRKKYVELLKQNGFDVEVLTVDYRSNSYYETSFDGINVTYFPYTINLRIGMCLERIGVLEDYLDYWCRNVVTYLRTRANSEDILFCTSGGELASIKVGSLLKKINGCKFVVNLHDPIDYTIVCNKKIDKKFHVSREENEKKYISNSDLIITSSNTLKESLHHKYSNIKLNITNGYFGYIEDMHAKKEKNYDGTLNIVYGGNFGELQRPEIFAKAALEVKGVHVHFVGNSSKYSPVSMFRGNKNVHFYDFMKYDEYCRFVCEKMDCGCVSLTSDYLGACVPSKIYEFINLATPMIACLPKGDAKDLIEKKKFGCSCLYSDIEKLCEILKQMKRRTIWENYRENIVSERKSWAMSERIKPIIKIIRNL